MPWAVKGIGQVVVSRTGNKVYCNAYFIIECNFIYLDFFYFSMIDISNAQLYPYRGFHYFHEDLNIYLKVSLSAALLLIQHSAEPGKRDQLNELIKLTHPSWNTPPVRDMSIDLQRRTHASISAYALVTVFSAFDDFLVGTEAELHRFHFGSKVKKDSSQKQLKMQPVVSCNTKTEAPIGKENKNEDEDEDDSEERLRTLYETNNWEIAPVESFLKVIRYFRLCRNCIAHRNGRASPALAKLSNDSELHKEVSGLLDKATSGLANYSINDSVFIEPTHAILCSHLLRRIARDLNKQLLGTLGFDGFLRSVAHHTMFGDVIVRSEAYKTAEAVLNFALTDRYRATMSNREESIQEMKRLGLWKRYMREFDRKYS